MRWPGRTRSKRRLAHRAQATDCEPVRARRPLIPKPGTAGGHHNRAGPPAHVEAARPPSRSIGVHTKPGPPPGLVSVPGRNQRERHMAAAAGRDGGSWRVPRSWDPIAGPRWCGALCRGAFLLRGSGDGQHMGDASERARGGVPGRGTERLGPAGRGHRQRLRGVPSAAWRHSAAVAHGIRPDRLPPCARREHPAARRQRRARRTASRRAPVASPLPYSTPLTRPKKDRQQGDANDQGNQRRPQ